MSETAPGGSIMSVSVDHQDMQLENVALVGSFGIGELLEALVLYRHVDIFVDMDNELRSLIHYLTPEGFVRLLQESGETVTVHVCQDRMVERSMGGRKEIYFGVDDYSSSAWTHMCELGGLPFWGPTWEESFWRGVSVDWAREQIHPFRVPSSFLSAMVSDERVLADRFAVYLRSSCLLSPTDSLSVGAIALEEEGGEYSRMQRFAMPTFECRLPQEQIDSAFRAFMFDSLNAYSTTVAPKEAHLILPRRGAVVVFLDAWRYATRIALGSATRQLAHDVLVPGAPQIAETVVAYDSVWKEPDLLALVLAARRCRLQLPMGVSVNEVVRDCVSVETGSAKFRRA